MKRLPRVKLPNHRCWSNHQLVISYDCSLKMYRTTKQWTKNGIFCLFFSPGLVEIYETSFSYDQSWWHRWTSVLFLELGQFPTNSSARLKNHCIWGSILSNDGGRYKRQKLEPCCKKYMRTDGRQFFLCKPKHKLSLTVLHVALQSWENDRASHFSCKLNTT
jgi:hypothetical protein